jgi:hypothetical protein
LEPFSDEVSFLRNGLAGPQGFKGRDGSSRQQAKGSLDGAHVSNPAVQRDEAILGGPGQVGVNHFLNPAFCNSSLGADLGVRKELCAKIKTNKYENKPVYE